MPEGMRKVVEPFLALSPSKRWMVIGVVAISAFAFAMLIVAANKVEYRPLFTNLTSEDAGEIVRKLKEQKVPYRIEGDGKTVMVQADKVYDLRLSLASEGLPQGGGIGFEIFDRKNFGMTEFVQKLNYQRALQGELGRTISQITGVEHARVHLAIPEKSLFTEREKSPTASIILKMKSSRNLQENEVQGIVHLVASSIEGMEPGNVTVLDSRGKILSKGGAVADAGGRMTTTMQETQRDYEKRMEEKLQSLLDKAVGTGKSVARVSASFDFRQVEKFEEKYDPDAMVVRSEQRSEEKGAATTVPSGIPGVQANTGKSAPAAPQRTVEGATRSDETRNYELGRFTARTIEPLGTLSKISVAVLVDGSYETQAAGKKGGATKPRYVPRTADELQKVESLVKSAAGFNVNRGDQVTVVNVPFQETTVPGDVEREKWWQMPILYALLKNAVIGMGFLVVLFLVVRPLMRTIRTNAAPLIDFSESAEEEVQKMLTSQRANLAKVSQIELIERVKKEPYQTAQILTNWLENK